VAGVKRVIDELAAMNGSMRSDKLHAALGIPFADMDAVCRRIADEAFGAAPENQLRRPENASLID
jgi:hypothetical protein